MDPFLGHVMSICFCFVSYQFLSTKTHLNQPLQTLPKVVASGEGDTGSSAQVIDGWDRVDDSDRYG